MKRPALAVPASLPMFLIIAAFGVALLGFLPGAADPVGAARIGACAALLLAAAFFARQGIVAWMRPRTETIALAVFALVTVLSVLRAADPLRALWGSPLLWTGSATLLLSAALLLVVVPAALTPRWRTALPGVLVGLLSINQLPLLIRSFAPQFAFPSPGLMTLGAATPAQAGMLSVVAALICAGEAMRGGRPVRSRALWAAAALLHLVLLVRIDRAVVWGALTLGLLVLLAHAVRRFDQVWRPATHAAFVAAAAALVLVFVRLPSPVSAEMPVEINLAFRETAAALGATWKNDPLSAALGASPGGFGAAFGRVRPASLNDTPFWNVRFPVPPSGVLQLLFEIGLCGAAAFIVIQISALRVGWRALAGQPQAKGLRRVFARRVAGDALPAAGMLAALAALLGASLVSLLPAAGMLCAALLSGWLHAQRADEKAAEPATKNDGQALLGGWLATAVLVLALVIAGLTAWQGASAVAAGAVLRAASAEEADRAYAAAVRLGQPPEIHAAAALQALFAAQQATTREEAAKSLSTAIDRARLAADGRNAAALEAAITVGVQAVAAGADAPELDGWIAAAQALEPTNPTFRIADGDVRVLRGDAAGAEAAYREAIRLAPLLAIPKARLAELLEAAGRTGEALQWYDAAARLAPDNAALRQRVERLQSATSTPATP